MKPIIRTYWSIAILLLITASALPVLAQRDFQITDGVCDARKTDFNNNRIQLNGYWKFFTNGLISPDSINLAKASTLPVPSLWDIYPDVKFGTYVLDILVGEVDGPLALEIPQLYNSYKLFVNDSLIACNGAPGITKETTAPEWRPLFATFTPSDTNRVVLQVSGFHHSKAGIREPIFLGSASIIKSHFSSTFISTLVESAVVFILAIVFVVIWYQRKKQTASLYFAIFCFVWGVRQLVSEVYPISTIYPDINWYFLVRVEYLTLFALMGFAVLFLNDLFETEASSIFKYMAIFADVVFALLTLIAPVETFTKRLPLYIAVAGIIIIYAGTVLVRALIRDKPGAWPLIAGILLLMFTTGYDLMAYNGTVVNQVLIGNIGYCLIYICCAIGILQHLGFMNGNGQSESRLTYKDLYK